MVIDTHRRRKCRIRFHRNADRRSALLEAMDPKRMPTHGGDATTVIVTISLEDLRKELGTGSLVPPTS